MLIACVVLATVSPFIWLGLRGSGPPEPVYQRKPLGYWLKVCAVGTAKATGLMITQNVFSEMGAIVDPSDFRDSAVFNCDI